MILYDLELDTRIGGNHKYKSTTCHCLNIISIGKNCHLNFKLSNLLEININILLDHLKH